MRARMVAGLMFGLALGAAPLHAQATAGSPRAVAQRVLGALASRNAAGFGRDMHPEALAAFKSGVVRGLSQVTAAGDKAEAEKFFQGDETFDQLSSMSAARFFTAYMGGVFQRMRDEGNVRVDYAVLGEVPEGNNLVHVVYRGRITAGDQTMSDVDILTLRRSPGGWKALLSGELRALAGPAAITE
ncbi:MAG TPA: hypothetical protein VFS94_02480 [Gemmatimonadales bacterium]|nr:hypothetical protein [Gemmatimonadales bacterium]